MFSRISQEYSMQFQYQYAGYAKCYSCGESETVSSKGFTCRLKIYLLVVNSTGGHAFTPLNIKNFTMC